MWDCFGKQILTQFAPQIRRQPVIEEIVPQKNPMVQFDTASAPSHPMPQSGPFNGRAIWTRVWVWSTKGGGGGGTDLRAWTDLTCWFISPLWWRTSSRGKRTWRISVLVILSHARCSICTGSRLNVNWMSNFFLFIYGILDKIIGKNVSRKSIPDKLGLSP